MKRIIVFTMLFVTMLASLGGCYWRGHERRGGDRGHDGRNEGHDRGGERGGDREGRH